MTIEELARKYKLKTKKIGEGEYVIPGKLGEIYMYDENEGLVGAMFQPPKPTKGWANRKKEFLEAGAVITQNGDLEGAVMFPAADSKLIRTAMRLLGIKSKRQMSPEQKKVLTDRLKSTKTKR